MEILEEPNTAPPVAEIWMWVSRDREGQENVLGATFPGIGMQPLVTGNPHVMQMMAGCARDAQRQLGRMGKTDQTIHLLRFTQREEIEEW